jgi:hypothetical protein
MVECTAEVSKWISIRIVFICFIKAVSLKRKPSFFVVRQYFTLTGRKSLSAPSGKESVATGDNKGIDPLAALSGVWSVFARRLRLLP